MPNADGTGNVLDGLKRIGMFAVVIALIILSSLSESWLVMTAVGFVSCAGMAKLATKGSLKNVLGWGTIGAIAGFGFWTTL